MAGQDETDEAPPEEKPFFATLAALAPLVAPYRRGILGSLAVLVVGLATTLVTPLLWRSLVDDVLVARRPDLFPWVFGAYMALGLFETVVSRLGWAASNRVRAALGTDLTRSLHAKLLRQTLGYLHQQRGGDLVERARSDVETVADGTQSLLMQLVRDGLKVVSSVAMLVWLSPGLGLSMLVPALAGLWFVYRANQRMAPRYRLVRKLRSHVTSLLSESVQGVAVLKAFGREPERHADFEGASGELADTRIATSDRSQLFYGAIAVFGQVGGFTVIGVGAWKVLHGSLTVGTLMAAQAYWSSIWWPLYGIAEVMDETQRIRVAAERVVEVLEAPEAVVFPLAPESPRTLDGSVGFEAVAYAYPNGKLALSGIDLAIRPGEHVALVGPSGAGKSSLLRLVLRFADPASGRVRIGGLDAKDLSRRELAEQVGLVEQDPFLFDASVAENLRVGKRSATDAELAEAARQAYALDFVTGLPKGFDTVVGERGVRLSGGQKQRLCIARAFLANPPVMLLDEATSSVEAEAETHILAALRGLMAGRTTLMVSHKLHLAREADRIVVVLDGSIAEVGTHQQLVAAGSWYARTWDLQSRQAAGEPVAVQALG